MKKHPVKQTTERRIAASLRIAMAVVLLVVNIGSVIILTAFLQGHAAIAFAALEIAAIAVAVNIQSSAVSSSYKLAWTLLVVALPVAGMVLYVLWGGNIQSKRLNLLPLPPPSCRDTERRRALVDQERLAAALPNWRRASELLQRRDFLLCRGTGVTYFSSGADFFADAVKRMARAERFIFLEFFILAEGQLWDQIREVLADRARRGVEVKIIFDDFGNITRMRAETIERMREEWKDGGVLLDGPGAWGLTAQFIHMWEMLGERLHSEHDFYRPLEEREAAGFCQPFGDGPMNNPDNPAEDLYYQCISNAHRSLWLTTPYFAVEDGMVRALCMAADSGVDVRLLLPGIPDHKYTYIVAGSYYERLLRHGVKIYEFTPGFLHLKSLVADGEIALVGSVNMDYRSFQLHYECGTVLYGAPAIREILADMEGVMARSAAVDPERWEGRSWFRKVLEKVLRVFSIWM